MNSRQFDWFWNLPILKPWMAPAGCGIGLLLIAALWLWRTREVTRRGWLVTVAVLAGVVAWLAIDVLWKPFADGVTPLAFAWVGALVLLVLQVIAGPWKKGDGRGTLAWASGGLGAILVSVIAAALSLNAVYGSSGTVGILLGRTTPTVQWASSAAADPHTVVPRSAWKPTEPLPAGGQVAEVYIPASDKLFHPRNALVYLPPAALGRVRPTLPVLVLMAGLPGYPDDWTGKGHMVETLDRYASDHGGIAPIVVVIDQLGGPLTNTLCSDAAAGNAATYVQRDVPAWIRDHLRVETNRSAWAIGGISNGGTCALQAIARDPSVYGTALVMSGETHPTLGKKNLTVTKGFGGDLAKFEENDPASLFAEVKASGDSKYRGTTVWFSTGDQDSYAGPGVARELASQAAAAGIETRVSIRPGVHGWATWAEAFNAELPPLADRMLSAKG